MTQFQTIYVAATRATDIDEAEDNFGSDGAEFGSSVDLLGGSEIFESVEFTLYGLALDRTQYEQLHGRPRSVIGSVTKSAGGNHVLRVGREEKVGGNYELTEHVVLTPAEARALALELLR